MSREWPDLGVLQLLVAVDERGSLGAASRSVGMAQPNASRALRQLENRLGTALLRRHPRGSTLTPEGTVIAHWAREVLDKATGLLDAAEALHATREPELTVASSMTVAEYLLPAWLGKFRRAHQDVHVHLQVLNSMQVFGRITEGACDLGFVESPSVPEQLHSVTVGSDRLVVVVAPDHRWARRRRPLTVGELAAAPLLAREPGSGTRRTVDLALAEFDRPAPILELGSGAAIRASVLGGVGPAVMSTLAIGADIAAGSLTVVQVDGLDLRRTLRAVWGGRRQLAGPAGDLVGLMVRGRSDPP